MRTIGTVLKQARHANKYTRFELEKITKIKKEFIFAIEKEDWENLPEYPVVRGFVKNVAEALKVNPYNAMALLRRDYPPKSLPINPKPDIKNKFSWSPRFTFVIATGVVSVFLIAYLVVTYLNFIRPPALNVISPEEGQMVTSRRLYVEGKTDPEATIRVNNQPTLVSEDGIWKTEIEIFEGTEEVVVIANSRSGKETVVRRSIQPELVN
jgi:cytoskeletal protein RodZ